MVSLGHTGLELFNHKQQLSSNFAIGSHIELPDLIAHSIEN